MKRPEKSTHKFLVDNNVFVSAIKHPGRRTQTLKLILRMIYDAKIELVMDALLLTEMKKYAQRFGSKTTTEIFDAIVAKANSVEVEEKFVKICKQYLPKKESADIVHAAACLQTGAILITNDKHFEKIRKEKIIKVWYTTEAIKRLR
ncbi:MAG: PIN domain-containing protein [Methanosarcinales archaeon Met12]|nr:MAG: PIN domain-containing protein [Methanosarcinales archaeon Met12]